MNEMPRVEVRTVLALHCRFGWIKRRLLETGPLYLVCLYFRIGLDFHELYRVGLIAIKCAEGSLCCCLLGKNLVGLLSLGEFM